MKWPHVSGRNKPPSTEQAMAVAAHASPTSPILGSYFRDRSRRKARIVRGVCWSLLVFMAFLYGLLFTFLPPSFVPPLLVPLLLLGGLVIWALPDATVGTKMLEKLLFAFFIALVIWPNYLAVALPGLPWITLARLFCIPAGIVLLYTASVSGEFANQIKSVFAVMRVPSRFLLVFLAVQVLSLAFSSNPFESFQKLVIDEFYWTATFFISVAIFLKTGRASRWVLVMLGMCLFLCALGFLELRLHRVPWAGHIPSFLAIDDPSVLRAISGASRAGTGIYRVQGTYSTSLGLAEYLALTTPFWIYCILELRGFWIRAFSLFAIPLLFVTILNTNARSGMVGFFLSVLLYLGLWGMKRWITIRRSIFGPALTLAYPAIAVSFLVATMFVGRLHSMVWGGANTKASTDARIEQVHTGIPKIIHWPFGYGVGQGAQVLGFTNGEGTLTIDSYYLNVGLEYGVVGFLAFYGLFVIVAGYGIHQGIRAKEGELRLLLPFSIAICVFLVTKSVYAQEPNHPIMFMILGAVFALVYRSREQAAPNIPRLYSEEASRDSPRR